MYSVKVLIFAASLVAVVSPGRCAINKRIIDGQSVDTLKQFPHHVTIVPAKSTNRCGGSILNKQWIVTAASCLDGYSRYEVHFNQKTLTDDDYFFLSVNKNNVYFYPTNYDNVALIKMPTQLVFSQSIQPINISTESIQSLVGKFVVLPGFPEEELKPTFAVKFEEEFAHDNLRYGMFQVFGSGTCKNLYSDIFDEYNQLCVGSWGSYSNAPCESDIGSGLVVGWPAKSELIGLFSVSSSGCKSDSPNIYTYTAKYLPWILNMINN